MFHKVKAVTPLSGCRLLVSFAGGERKQYDVKPLCGQWDAFKPLLYVAGLFEQVCVDGGGYGVSWNADIDLSCEELYENGVTPGEGEREEPPV